MQTGIASPTDPPYVQVIDLVTNGKYKNRAEAVSLFVQSPSVLQIMTSLKTFVTKASDPKHKEDLLRLFTDTLNARKTLHEGMTLLTLKEFILFLAGYPNELSKIEYYDAMYQTLVGLFDGHTEEQAETVLDQLKQSPSKYTGMAIAAITVKHNGLRKKAADLMATLVNSKSLAANAALSNFFATNKKEVDTPNYQNQTLADLFTRLSTGDELSHTIATRIYRGLRNFLEEEEFLDFAKRTDDPIMSMLLKASLNNKVLIMAAIGELPSGNNFKASEQLSVFLPTLCSQLTHADSPAAKSFLSFVGPRRSEESLPDLVDPLIDRQETSFAATFLTVNYQLYNIKQSLLEKAFPRNAVSEGRAACTTEMIITAAKQNSLTSEVFKAISLHLYSLLASRDITSSVPLKPQLLSAVHSYVSLLPRFPSLFADAALDHLVSVTDTEVRNFLLNEVGKVIAANPDVTFEPRDVKLSGRFIFLVGRQILRPGCKLESVEPLRSAALLIHPKIPKAHPLEKLPPAVLTEARTFALEAAKDDQSALIIASLLPDFPVTSLDKADPLIVVSVVSLLSLHSAISVLSSLNPPKSSFLGFKKSSQNDLRKTILLSLAAIKIPDPIPEEEKPRLLSLLEKAIPPPEQAQPLARELAAILPILTSALGPNPPDTLISNMAPLPLFSEITGNYLLAAPSGRSHCIEYISAWAEHLSIYSLAMGQNQSVIDVSISLIGPQKTAEAVSLAVEPKLSTADPLPFANLMKLALLKLGEPFQRPSLLIALAPHCISPSIETRKEACGAVRLMSNAKPSNEDSLIVTPGFAVSRAEALFRGILSTLPLAFSTSLLSEIEAIKEKHDAHGLLIKCILLEHPPAVGRDLSAFLTDSPSKGALKYINQGLLSLPAPLLVPLLTRDRFISAAFRGPRRGELLSALISCPPSSHTVNSLRYVATLVPETPEVAGQFATAAIALIGHTYAINPPRGIRRVAAADAAKILSETLSEFPEPVTSDFAGIDAAMAAMANCAMNLSPAGLESLVNCLHSLFSSPSQAVVITGGTAAVHLLSRLSTMDDKTSTALRTNLSTDIGKLFLALQPAQRRALAYSAANCLPERETKSLNISDALVESLELPEPNFRGATLALLSRAGLGKRRPLNALITSLSSSPVSPDAMSLLEACDVKLDELIAMRRPNLIMLFGLAAADVPALREGAKRILKKTILAGKLAEAMSSKLSQADLATFCSDALRSIDSRDPGEEGIMFAMETAKLFAQAQSKEAMSMRASLVRFCLSVLAIDMNEEPVKKGAREILQFLTN